MYETFCGIDFGTTNSVVSVLNKNKVPELIKFHNNQETIPTAIFFPEEETFVPLYGDPAIENYIKGQPGRLMRSLKRILGTDLMNVKTEVNGARLAYEDIILKFIKFLKQTAESQIKTELKDVVFGRPVHFQDFSPDSDEKAENLLRHIAVNAGFKNVTFRYEPLAAAYAHETLLDTQKLACIIDIGGGTSDFSIIQLVPELRKKPNRQKDILANSGIRIGGNDFDRDLSIKCFMPEMGYGTLLKPDDYTQRILPVPASPYIRLSEWSSINSLYTYKEQKNIEQMYMRAAEPQKVKRIYEIIKKELGHTLLNEVEKSKIALTGQPEVITTLDFLTDKPHIKIDAETFYNSIKNDSKKIIDTLQECLCQAGVKASAIDLVVLTGGSTEIPYIKKEVMALFPQAAVSAKNRLSSVAQGLAYAASYIYK